MPRRLQIPVAPPPCPRALPLSHGHSQLPHVHPSIVPTCGSAQRDTRTPSSFPSPPGDADAAGHFPGVTGQAAPPQLPCAWHSPPSSHSHLEQSDKATCATQARSWAAQCPLAPWGLTGVPTHPGDCLLSPRIPVTAPCAHTSRGLPGVPPTSWGLPSVPTPPRDCPAQAGAGKGGYPGTSPFRIFPVPASTSLRSC